MRDVGLTSRTTGEEIRARLGFHRLGQPRAVDALAGVVVGGDLEVVCVVTRGVWDWTVVATNAGLWLARRPRVFGRARDEYFAWKELTAVESGHQSVALNFGERTLSVTVVSLREYTRLLGTARRHLHGVVPGTTLEQLHAMARDGLGRMARTELAVTIDRVQGRLEPGESVEWVARAALDFSGLLLVTDVRLLLLESSGRAEPREWSVRRSEIHSAALLTDGVGLQVDGRMLTLTGLAPADAALELVSTLPGRAAGELADAAAPEPDSLLRVRSHEPSMPAEAWRLTAPESYILRFAPSEPGFFPPFRLAVKELVARDVLRLVGARTARAGGLGQRREWLLTDGSSIGRVSDSALIAAVAIYQHAREHHAVVGTRIAASTDTVEGVRLSELREEKAAWRALGANFASEVLNSLQHRGLLTGTLAYTDAGRAADEQLDAWLALGRARLADWAASRTNVSRAVEYVRGAGSAVFLLPDAAAALDSVGVRVRAGDVELTRPVAEQVVLSGPDGVFTTVDKGLQTILVYT